MKSKQFFTLFFALLWMTTYIPGADAHPRHRHHAAGNQDATGSSQTTPSKEAKQDATTGTAAGEATAETIATDSPRPKCAGLPCIDELVPVVDDVYYTVTESHNTVAVQASKWGVPVNVLTILNQGLTEKTVLEPGQKLLVEARLPSEPAPYSSGRPNRGRVRNARLMPEGEGYFLRDVRSNEWGTDLTVQSLMTAFQIYAQKYPDAPRINVGDISRRRGGRLSPHKSHQSGRDVDIGFVHTQETAKGARQHFSRANSDNLDIEKTWFFIKTLIQTDNVQKVFVDTNVQKLLWQAAKEELTPEQREMIFSWPHNPNSYNAIFQHWPGHRNHFHVRFKCPQDQPGCLK